MPSPQLPTPMKWNIQISKHVLISALQTLLLSFLGEDRMASRAKTGRKFRLLYQQSYQGQVVDHMRSEASNYGRNTNKPTLSIQKRYITTDLVFYDHLNAYLDHLNE